MRNDPSSSKSYLPFLQIWANRHSCSPSETFREQLALWYKAKFKASVRDRDIRQWYMERTAVQVRSGSLPFRGLGMWLIRVIDNGELEEEATQHMAKYPATPTPSMPATPVGGYGKRKIRCKMCRYVVPFVVPYTCAD